MASDNNNEKSFQVGDRVVLQGLRSATHLNGRHGYVAVPLNAQGRFGVDVDVDSQRRAIKPGNLIKEVDDDEDLTIVSPENGILPEHPHGRAASYLLDLMRINAGYYHGDYGELTQFDIERFRSTPQGMLKVAHLTSLGWTNWMKENQDGLELGDGDEDSIYELTVAGNKQTLEEFEQKGVKESEVPQELLFAREALQSKHAAGGWHVRVHGNFWVVGESPETGACYLIPEENKHMVYEVLGIRNALYPMVSRHGPTRPLLFAATLIPWYGRLLYDGVVMPAYNLRMPKQASPALADKLQESVRAAVEEGRVITRLRDTQGITDPAMAPAPPAPVQPNRDPPTREERRYMNQLADLPGPVEMEGDFEVVKPWAWTFRRGGYTEEENPTHSGFIIAAAGFIIGPFDCSALAPSSVDILQNTVNYARQFNRQPKVLSIDERVCCDRLKFILQDTPIRVEYYRPPSKEETAAAMAMPPQY